METDIRGLYRLRPGSIRLPGEMICLAFHATPKYGSNNPARSRIRMIREPIRDICSFYAVDNDVKMKDVGAGLESLIEKYGLEKITDAVARMSRKG